MELKDIEELDRDIIVEMIDQITVYENRKLKISYNFGNELEHLFSSVYCEDLEKRLSNLNTFLTPHIYWGIHITICVNYNQHMVEVIPVRFPPPASWKRMSTSVLQWLLNSCLKTEALLLS